MLTEEEIERYKEKLLEFHTRRMCTFTTGELGEMTPQGFRLILRPECTYCNNHVFISGENKCPNCGANRWD